MDVNLHAEVKGYGSPAVPVVEQEDRVKPQVAPVKKNTESSTAKLDDQALHRRNKEEPETAGPLTQEELEEMMVKVQNRLDSIGGNLKLGLWQNQETESIVVQIKDRSNGELVRQFPSEELLKLQAKLEELSGLLFDESA